MGDVAGIDSSNAELVNPMTVVWHHVKSGVKVKISAKLISRGRTLPVTLGTLNYKMVVAMSHYLNH